MRRVEGRRTWELYVIMREGPRGSTQALLGDHPALGLLRVGAEADWGVDAVDVDVGVGL